MLEKLFQRLRDLRAEGKLPPSIPEFDALLSGEPMSLEDYYVLDEYACSYAFEVLSRGEDPIAADLASRILDRRLFDYMEDSPENRKKVTDVLLQAGYDPEYYLTSDDVGQRVYIPYRVSAGNAIRVRLHGGEIKELSEASNIVQSLVKGKPLRDDRIYYPKEIRDLL